MAWGLVLTVNLLPAYCSFISYRTSQYKLHYYETPTNLKFVMLTDTRTINLRHVLNQIYINLYVEFGPFLFCRCEYSMTGFANLQCLVVKNPLSPVEHPGGVGVNCEMFEAGLDQFVVSCAICNVCGKMIYSLLDTDKRYGMNVSMWACIYRRCYQG